MVGKRCEELFHFLSQPILSWPSLFATLIKNSTKNNMFLFSTSLFKDVFPGDKLVNPTSRGLYYYITYKDSLQKGGIFPSPILRTFDPGVGAAPPSTTTTRFRGFGCVRRVRMARHISTYAIVPWGHRRPGPGKMGRWGKFRLKRCLKACGVIFIFKFLYGFCMFFASKVVIDDFLWFWRGKLLLHEHIDIAGCSKMDEKGCLQYLRV